MPTETETVDQITDRIFELLREIEAIRNEHRAIVRAINSKPNR